MAQTGEVILTEVVASDAANETSRAKQACVGMYVALIAAWVATCGSLYMSEVLGWIPCLWCWYQRIAMYPLAVLLAVGLIWGDRNVPKYALSLELISEMVSEQNPNACQMHEADVVFDLILIAHCNRSATSCSGVQPSIAACNVATTDRPAF